MLFGIICVTINTSASDLFQKSLIGMETSIFRLWYTSFVYVILDFPILYISWSPLNQLSIITFTIYIPDFRIQLA